MTTPGVKPEAISLLTRVHRLIHPTPQPLARPFVDGTQVLPPAVLRGENLFVGDDDISYYRETGYPVSLHVMTLRLRSNFAAPETGSPDISQARVDSIVGHATVADNEKFAVAGLDVSKTNGADLSIQVWINGVDAESPNAWQAHIAFDRTFSLTCNLPRNVFDGLADTFREKRGGVLRIKLDTAMMWIKAIHFMPQRPLTFYLAPPQARNSTTPDPADARVMDVDWAQGYDVEPRAPKKKPLPYDDEKMPWWLAFVILIGLVWLARGYFKF